MRLFRKSISDLSDEALMQALGQGDQSAFTELYERYSGKLRGYFRNMLWRDEEKAEDFVHDLFAKIIQHPELFDTSRSFKTWLFSVASNMCKNEYKRMEVRKNMVQGVDTSFAASSENVLNQVQDTQFLAEFEQKLQSLDEKHRSVFTMRHLDGLSLKEIAEILEINEGTVKSRLFYATKFLANQLSVYQLTQ
ncbi:MAG: RNA polymerase sigma factor [Flavobacteriales bacterium]